MIRTRPGNARRALVPALALALAPAALAVPTTSAAAASGEESAVVRRTDNRTTYRTAAPIAPPPPVALRTWAVADLDTGRLLATSRAYVRRQPASTIKLLSAITAARRVAARPTHRVTWREAHPEFCICVGLRVGRRYSRDALMAAMLLPSANDAAEATAGSDPRGRRGFVRAMNRIGERLGLRRTRAVNPSGLTARGASTTARDLLVLLRAAQADPTVAPFLGARTARFGPLWGETRTIRRTNSYVDRFPEAEGKTGFTTAAGYNLVVAHPARDADGTVRRIGVAALGSTSRDASNRSVEALVRWTAGSYSSLRPLGTLPPAPGPVIGAQARWVEPVQP